MILYGELNAKKGQNKAKNGREEYPHFSIW